MGVARSFVATNVALLVKGDCGIHARMVDKPAEDHRHRLPLVEDAPGMAPTRYSPDILAGIALGEASALAVVVTHDVQSAIDAAEQACVRAEQLVGAAMHHEPPEMPIACRRGCSTCCQAKVLVVAPEVIRIGAFLRRTKTAQDLTQLLERIRETDALTRGLSRDARAEAHVPCPLLDTDGGCSVHDVRPLVCRSWTSYDAGACITYWQAPTGRRTPPQWPVGYELLQAVLAGLGRACVDRGLDGMPLEFIAALRIVLERPNAGERWLKKLPVFSLARDHEWADAQGRT